MNWQDHYAGQTVLVTGCCGTVGAELIRQLLTMDVKSIRGVDNVEEHLFYQQNKYRNEPKYINRFADITNLNQLTDVMRDVDIIIHAAALKQVPVCEEVPNAAVATNIIGVQNVIQAAILSGVKRVLFTSSDKAVNPTNVMGTSKLMGERLITAANLNIGGSDTIFASTRFGNVAGSKGSVIPVFERQILNGQDITLTSREMTRFIMTNKEACSLVLKSTVMAQGGEVFVTKMPVLRIEDLAEVMRQEVSKENGLDPDAVKIFEIGPRPGEKDYEELTTDEEVRRTLEDDQMLIVIPANSSIYDEVTKTYGNTDLRRLERAYHSAHESAMAYSEIKDILVKIGLLGKTG